MPTASVIYQGQLRCQATHNQSGSIMETDAPTDNRGKGERFSPTDLLCVSLGTCIITTMGIKATDMEIDLTGATLQIQKHMYADPRRVGKIEITIDFPKALNLSEKDRTILQRVGDSCPVQKSIHPDIETVITYNW
ncbi:MAG: OsmC family peroxiredoxin [Sphingobacteriales bacterium]|jgi:putative redox protein|nr:MAG: OsmC family peroxiredoxin [Sphingobacteriales bacterium]